MTEHCRSLGIVHLCCFPDASAALGASLPGDVVAIPPGVHSVEELGELEEGGTVVCIGEEPAQVFYQFRSSEDDQAVADKVKTVNVKLVYCE